MVKRLNLSIFWIEVIVSLTAVALFGFFTVLGFTLLTSALGLMLLREQGVQWRIPQVSTQTLSGRMLRTLAGVLLLLPGVLTDLVGLLCWGASHLSGWQAWLQQRFAQPRHSNPSQQSHTQEPRQSSSTDRSKPHKPDIIEGEFWRDDEK